MPITRSLKRKASTPPIPIQTSAQRSAMRDAFRASAGTRAPMLCPTSAVAAIEKPKAGRKASESAVKVICCAARAWVPIRATTAIRVMNAPDESTCSRAAGTPERQELAGGVEARAPAPGPAERDRLAAARHHQQHVGGAERAAGRGAERAAGDAQRRQPEVTEDQHVGDDDVDDVGQHRRLPAACGCRPAPRSTAPQTNERKSATLVAAVTCR